MAPSSKLMMVPLLALLFMSGTLEAARESNDTSADGTDHYSRSPGANGSASAPRGRLLGSSSQSVFSLDSYGARGDGSHDDTQALARAWKAACTSPRPAVLLVPSSKRYLLKVVSLSGPCKSNVTFTVKGTRVASPNRADWSDKDRSHWIVFRSVNKLTVNGGGAIDGNGDKWWPHSCKINKALVSVAPMLWFIPVIF